MTIEITKYKSEVSGQIYDTKEAAERDEKRNLLKSDIIKFYKDHKLIQFTPNDIAEWVVLWWDELKVIIEDKPQDRAKVLEEIRVKNKSPNV